MAVDKFSSAAGPNTGLIKVVPTSVAVGSGSASVDTNGSVTFSGATSLVIDGIFTSNYANYRVIYEAITISGNGGISLEFRRNGVTTQDSYLYNKIRSYSTLVNSATGGTTNIDITYGGMYAAPAHSLIEIMGPQVANKTSFNTRNFVQDSTEYIQSSTAGYQNSSTQFDGIRFAGPTLSGSVRIYAYNQ